MLHWLTSKLRKRSTTGEKPAGADLAGSDEARYKPIEWPLIRRLLSYLRPYRKQYALAIGVGLVHVLADMSGPQFFKHLINYTQDFVSGKLPGTPAESAAIAHVMLFIGLWGTVNVLSFVLQRITILVMSRAGESVQVDLRRKIFEHLQRLSMSYYDKTKLGRIISRCTSDIGALSQVNVWGIWRIINNTMQMTVAAGMLLWTDWRLFLAVAWLGPVLFVANRIYGRKIALGWQIVREGFTRVQTNMAENITGVRVVTAFNRQSTNLGTFNTLQVVNTENNLYVARINGFFQPLLQFIGFIARAIVLTYGAYLLYVGRIEKVGSVVAAFMYTDWFMNPIINMSNFYNTILQAMASGERLFNLLDTKPDVQDVAGAKPLPPIAGHVTFEHVTFGYNPERPVLHDINFEAHPGEMVALVGATGSGKSSIVSLIARFYQPQQGRILVDGHDIRYHTGESLNRQTGLVLQTNYLFTGTVIDNIRYARPAATDEEVIAAAKAIGSYDAIMALANGFATEVGERGASTSLGQRQLICFTRAFLADPRIFMLDEATSAVDTETELQVQRSLEKLLENRTTFIVAHRLSTILRADCILVVSDGRIVERGTHRELLEAHGKYAHLYEQFAHHAA